MQMKLQQSMCNKKVDVDKNVQDPKNVKKHGYDDDDTITTTNDHANKKLKILITGATGMLGRSILRYLTQPVYESKYEVTGTGFHRIKTNARNMKKLNLLHPNEITSIIDEIKPNIVIHCAAERFPDRAAADPERTRVLNVDSTLNLAKECCRSDINAVIIYISTDYVFDGGIKSNKKPPYATDDVTMPINIYGETKLAGEKAVLSVENVKSIIVRVPVLYAMDCEELSESASLVVAKSLLSSNKNTAPSTTVDNWGIRYPTLVDDVSVILQKIIDATQIPSNPLSKGDGIKLHISSDEQCTKYQLMQLMAKIVKVDVATSIQPNNNPPSGAPRPKNTHLDCSKTWEVLGMKEPYKFVKLEDGFRDALLPFMDKFQK